MNKYVTGDMKIYAHKKIIVLLKSRAIRVSVRVAVEVKIHGESDTGLGRYPLILFLHF